MLVTTDHPVEGIKFAQQALTLLAEADLYLRSQAAMTLGVAYRATGELVTAQQMLQQGIEDGLRCNNLIWTLAALYYSADILVEQGQLRQASAQLQRGPTLVSRPASGWPWPIIDSTLVGLGRLARPQNAAPGRSRAL